jgi:enamine deaminase RidA (YjgF/YER057c/UK114 family)
MDERIRASLDGSSIVLERQPAPRHPYLSIRRDGDTIYLSGKTAMRDGAVVFRGRLETEDDIDRGRRAATLCAVNLLATIEHEIGLECLESVLKLTGYVSSGPEFSHQPQVINAASELLLTVLGEAGAHARSAVGVAVLPGDSTVEIDLIARLKTGAVDGRS